MVKKPYTIIHAFKPTENKVRFIAKLMLEEPLYLSDEFRNPQTIQQVLIYYLYGSNAMWYELGDFGGILAFINVSPGYKAEILFWLWDKKVWSPGMAKELRDFSSDFMKWYKLKRLSASTPDERGVRIAEMAGFKVEGKCKFGFRWNGVLHTNVLLRKLWEGKKWLHQ